MSDTLTKDTVYSLASEMAAAFETAIRPDRYADGTPSKHGGDTFYRLKGGSPEWMTDIIHACHHGMFPDDYRYRVIFDACEHIVDCFDADTDTDEMRDDMDFPDRVDVYNSDLAAWLGSHSARGEYVNEARAELGATDSDFDIWSEIQRGQYMERDEIYRTLIDQLESIAD